MHIITNWFFQNLLPLLFIKYGCYFFFSDRTSSQIQLNYLFGQLASFKHSLNKKKPGVVVAISFLDCEGFPSGI